MSRKNNNNPFYLLLVKYNGELLDASPTEIAKAERKSKTPGGIRRARKQAHKTYETHYDDNGIRRIDNPMRGMRH